MKMKRLITLIIIVILAFPIASIGQSQPVRPTMKDKCPICGMFVAKYPDFLAEILFKNGSYAVFDGVKDMFKYYFNIKKYNPPQDKENIEAIYVTDYYSLNLIDGLRAYYVLGSNVYGPMGNELIPFAKESDAKEFMKDHQGKSIVTFQDVKYETVKALD
jgi:nitrous oxide reductase accessory protein NosL